MQDFSKALAQCMKRGDMTVSDLARWFDRPRATINTWVNGRTPYGPSGRLAFRLLELLQSSIRNKQGFPIPETLSWSKRADYIRGIRDAAERNCRVPSARIAV
jgi:hypothetical protein